MSKQKSSDNKPSTQQSTPAPKIKSSDPGFDKFVEKAFQTVFKPKK